MAESSAASRLAGARRESAGAAGVSAGLGTRILAYLIDTIVLFGFACLFAAIALLVIFVSSDFGEGNASDGAFLALVLIVIATMPGWILLSAFLLWKRGQSIGQYVMNLRAGSDDGGEPTGGQVLLYCAALHPLIFHPIMAGLWAFAAWESVVLESQLLLYVSLGMVFLCLGAPFASLLFALFDSASRGIHDRIAGMRVYRIEEPE